MKKVNKQKKNHDDYSKFWIFSFFSNVKYFVV